MNNNRIPDVILPATDHRRLERLAQMGADRGNVDARFLLNEVNRAQVIPDRTVKPGSIVTMGSWVTFWIDWGLRRETRQLVYPEDYTYERTQILVTSPLGAALVGLKVGSEIPFFAAGRTSVVTVERVSRTGPDDVVRVLFGKPGVQRAKRFADDDPGPSAA